MGESKHKDSSAKINREEKPRAKKLSRAEAEMELRLAALPEHLQDKSTDWKRFYEVVGRVGR